MATAKVMRTAAFTGCDAPRGEAPCRARPQQGTQQRQSGHGPAGTSRRRRYAGQMRTSATAVMGRSPWMNDRVGVLLRFLARRHGLHVPWELARVQISGHVDLLASMFQLDRQAARTHVTDEVLGEIACDIAATITRK
ncbi:hypothetical protein ACWDTP_10590 [Mycobacterium sp. NPDC003449]